MNLNNLIQKAINGIKEGKNDYVIGLLEGALELTAPGPIKEYTTKINEVGAHIVVEKEPEKSPLDMEASAKIAEIKRLAAEGNE